MNFFEQQSLARRNTGRLVVLMSAAVVSLIAITSVTLIVLWHLFGEEPARHAQPQSVMSEGRLVFLVSLAVILVVMLGYLFKSMQLSSGGKAVAERLGGRLLNLAPQSFEEKQVLNVVEEMAIASGTPVPPVYVLEDAGINAFAAGLTPQDAVIGITQGAIALLSRDELQGVIAHEFSHIFHGDMRLNTRLVSVLHGILLIGLIGEFLLRGTRNRSSRSKGNSELAFLAFGVVLFVIGYTGTFFGNLIKAAVSRQREFLADASAVQFTRNPDSIGGALKKIGGFSQGSALQAVNAAEFSHMYFGQAVKLGFFGLMETHPPLAVRIRRIEPYWDGRFPSVALPASFYTRQMEAKKPTEPLAQEHVHGDTALGVLVATTEGYSTKSAEQSIGAIGVPQPAHLQSARISLQRLPDSLREAAHDCAGAEVLVYGLLVSREQPLQSQQLDMLRPRLDPAIGHTLDRLLEPLLSLDANLRLPLVELAIPALKQLGMERFAGVKRNLVRLAKADQHVSLMEWALYRIIERNVQGSPAASGQLKLIDLPTETAVLMSALAQAGNEHPQAAREAFAQAFAALPFDKAPPHIEGEPDLKALDHALSRLNRIYPLHKPRLLKAMVLCIEHDGQITAAEAELMRAVADILDCPMPPMLAIGASAV